MGLLWKILDNKTPRVPSGLGAEPWTKEWPGIQTTGCISADNKYCSRYIFIGQPIETNGRLIDYTRGVSIEGKIEKNEGCTAFITTFVTKVEVSPTKPTLLFITPYKYLILWRILSPLIIDSRLNFVALRSSSGLSCVELYIVNI